MTHTQTADGDDDRDNTLLLLFTGEAQTQNWKTLSATLKTQYTLQVVLKKASALEAVKPHTHTHMVYEAAAAAALPATYLATPRCRRRSRRRAIYNMGEAANRRMLLCTIYY